VTKKASRTVRWSAVVLWAAAIFAASAMPGSNLPGGYSVQAHLIEYFVLSALLYLALSVDRDRRSAILLAIVLASAYGISDEFHQSFVPMRTPDTIDWLTDTLGAAAGALTAAWVVAAAAKRRGSRQD